MTQRSGSAPEPSAREPGDGGGRILLLEDDRRLRAAFTGRLENDGFEVDPVGTLATARAAIAARSYRCLVLDRLVPDGDALDLVTEEDHLADTPVMVLTALTDSSDRVDGLRAGADDYVTKPVRLDELSLRVRRLAGLRRSAVRRVVRLGRVELDLVRHRARIDGEPVHLTPRQHAVLLYLATHRDRVVSTEELLDHCWDRRRRPFSSPLHSQIVRLRRSFAEVLAFEDVRGGGYLLRVTGEETAPDVGGRAP